MSKHLNLGEVFTILNRRAQEAYEAGPGEAGADTVKSGFGHIEIRHPGEICFASKQDCKVNDMLKMVRDAIGWAVPGTDEPHWKPEWQTPAWVVGIDTKVFFWPGPGHERHPLTEPEFRAMLDWPGKCKYFTNEMAERAEKSGATLYDLPEHKKYEEYMAGCKG